jgi:rare lipoprotein A
MKCSMSRTMPARRNMWRVTIKARHALQIMLLCLVSIGSAQARTSANSGLQNAGAQQSASPDSKKMNARKGLSGKASYYANGFHGRKTASGHPYQKEAMTAAHRSLPLGTWVRVINESNGNFVVVQITDRGPFIKNRVIDLSLAAAKNLDMLKQGTVTVSLEVVQEFSQAGNVDLLADARYAYGYGADREYY